MNIAENSRLPNGIDRLVTESTAQGFRFLGRLLADYRSGKNRFSEPGEALFSVTNSTGLIAIGGLNIDPYSTANIGRIRRVYVSKNGRGQGVGSALIAKIEAKAVLSFNQLRLFTDTKEADLFYCNLGYFHIDCEHATHAKHISA